MYMRIHSIVPMSGKQVTKAKFEIGENEKHTIIVNANLF